MVSLMRREPLVGVCAAACALMLAVFVLFPLFEVFYISVRDGQGQWFVHYVTLLRNPVLREPLLNTLWLAVVVSVTSTVIGYFLAFAVSRTTLPWKGFFRSVANFPLIVPSFIVALSAIILLGRNGVITRLCFPGSDFSIYGFWGLVLIQTLSFFPLAYLVCLGILDAIDPSVEEASLNQGASMLQTLRRVTFPLSLPGIVSALLLCFIESLSDFTTPLIIGGGYRVLSVAAYTKIVGAERDLAGGAALAMLMLVPALLAFFAQKVWLERKSFATVTGKPSTARIMPLPRLVQATITTLAGLLAAGIIVFYLTLLYGSFTKVWGAQYGLTLAHYVTTFRDGWNFVSNSFLVATVATPITGLFGMILAYLFVRKRFAGRGTMEAVSMLSIAVPGTVFGIGYILAFNQAPLLLQGTMAIIVLLHIVRNVPVGIRAGVATLKQIHHGIEEAAHNLGADSPRVFRTITLPLIAPAFYSGLAFSFIRCMTAISAVIFVVSARWNLIPIAILGYVEYGELSQAAALCVLLVVVVALVLGLLQIAVHGRQREFVAVGN